MDPTGGLSQLQAAFRSKYICFMVFFILYAVFCIANIGTGVSNGETSVVSVIIGAVLNILYLISIFMNVQAWKNGKPHNACLGIFVFVVMILSLIGLFFLGIAAIILITGGAVTADGIVIVYAIVSVVYLIVGLGMIISYFML